MAQLASEDPLKTQAIGKRAVLADGMLVLIVPDASALFARLVILYLTVPPPGGAVI